MGEGAAAVLAADGGSAGSLFCVFLSFRESHFIRVPGRPSGTEEVSLWAEETLGLGSASSVIAFRAE